MRIYKYTILSLFSFVNSGNRRVNPGFSFQRHATRCYNDCVMDVLAELNPAQREAAGATDGPVLILAGPGSGKTRVITHRIAYLIKTCGVSPSRIMAVTFTNKAAREMEERLHRLVGGQLKELTLGTFHAICARILRRDGQALGVDPRFVIYDDEDQISLIKRGIKGIGLDPKQHAPRAIASAISAAKVQMITPRTTPDRPTATSRRWWGGSTSATSNSSPRVAPWTSTTCS